MGNSLVTLGKALSVLISSEKTGGRDLEVIGAPKDGSNLLADLHHEDPVSRQKIMSSNLDTS